MSCNGISWYRYPQPKISLLSKRMFCERSNFSFKCFCIWCIHLLETIGMSPMMTRSSAEYLFFTYARFLWLNGTNFLQQDILECTVFLLILIIATLVGASRLNSVSSLVIKTLLTQSKIFLTKSDFPQSLQPRRSNSSVNGNFFLIIQSIITHNHARFYTKLDNYFVFAQRTNTCFLVI